MSSHQIHQSGLDVILDAQSRLSRTQEQLASGKNMLSPSDDPVATAQIQSIRSELSRIEALQSNIAYASRELALVEDAVANIEGILTRARELAVRSGNASLTDADRTTIAAEIDGLREQLISAANARSPDGDYVFAGYAVDSAPYTDAGINATYNGDDGEKAVNIAPGLTVTTRSTGKSVLGAGSEETGRLNAFEALSVLSAVLKGELSEAFVELTQDGNQVNEESAVEISMQALDANLENVRSVRTDLGTRMNRVEDQELLNTNFNLRLQTALSSLEDLDYTKAITEMNLQMVALEAAQKAYTKTQSLSLFNYL